MLCLIPPLYIFLWFYFHYSNSLTINTSFNLMTEGGEAAKTWLRAYFMSELMSRCCRERRTDVPLTCPWIPPESGPPLKGSDRRRIVVRPGLRFHNTHNALLRVPTGAHDVISSLPVGLTAGQMAHERKVRGKRNVYERVKFKLRSDKTEILHWFSAWLWSHWKLKNKNISKCHTHSLEYIF